MTESTTSHEEDGKKIPLGGILLVAYHYPPRHSIGSVRSAAFARDLSSLGWDVRVITVTPGVRGARWSIPSLMPLSPERVSNPKLAGVDEMGPDAKSLIRRVRRTLRRFVSQAYRRAVAIPDPEVFQWPSQTLLGRKRGTWTPDIILASGPPFSTFLAARLLARQYRVQWIADYRDLWTNGSYYSLGRIRWRLDNWLERRLLASARAIVTVSEPLAHDLEHLANKPVHVVLNGFDSADDDFSRDDAVTEHLSLVYTGEIYPERRDPRPLFKAISSLGDTARHVRVSFYGSTVGVVSQMAEEYGISEQITVSPKVSLIEAQQLQRDADVLLLLLWNHPGEAGVYSGKLFEYIGSRHPILMLGYSNGVAADLIRQRGLGRVANSPDEIESVLREWIELKARAGRLPITPSEATKGLTRREQSLRMSSILRDIVLGENTSSKTDLGAKDEE